MKKATMYTTILQDGEIRQQTYETSMIPDAKEQEMFVVNVYPNKKYQTIQGTTFWRCCGATRRLQK